MTSMGSDPSKLISALEKSSTELKGLADQAPNAEQKSAIQELAKYWDGVADATKNKDTKKLAELSKSAGATDGPLVKASMTLGKCSV